MKLIKASVALAIAAALLFGGRALAKEYQRTIELSVTEKGYEPSPIRVQKGQPVKLVVTRKTEKTCATELILPEFKIEKPLPLNKPVEITFTPDKSGQLKYGCAMGMMIAGVITVE